MGVIDRNQKTYFGERRRFADLWNGLAFQGEQKIRWEELAEGNTVQTVSSGEFLYHFRKEDKIRPVATLVLYWGENGWDGARSLKELIDFEGVEEMESFVPEYPIRVINLAEIKDTSVFQTELRPLIDLYQRRNRREDFKEYIRSHPEEMDPESMELLSVLTKSKELKRFLEVVKAENRAKAAKRTEQTSVGSAQRTVNTGDSGSTEVGGKKKMCRALTEWIEEERSEGRQEGRQETVVQLAEALMANLGTGMEEACRVLNIPIEEYRKAKGI